MTIQRIVPILTVDAIADALAFYRDVLGMTVVMDLDWIVTLIDPDNPNTQLSLITHDASAPVNPDVSIGVDNVDSVHSAAVAQGLPIVHPLTDEPWGVRRFFVRPPGGQVINVVGHH